MLLDPEPGTYTARDRELRPSAPTDDWFGGEVAFGPAIAPVPPSGVEKWTLTCNGATSEVEVDRGEVKDIDGACG